MTNQNHAAPAAPRPTKSRQVAVWPGTWQASATALLSGIAFWFLVLPQLSGDSRPQGNSGSIASEIAEVSDEDLTGALSTMNLAGPILERLRSGTRDCGARLAWVTLSRPNDDTAKPVRIRSGNYVSPSFVVAKTPVRVAIPYPAPYDTGHGSLTVFGVDNNLTVALSPAWQVSSDISTATPAVIWHPVKACAKP